MKILESIASPKDLRDLGKSELDELCGEIREFLVNTVSKTGGHLASSLGVVELTVALHRVFSLKRDRLVFDVGHQCYVHKLLTGRREDFDKLRQFGGLSGFPKPHESEYDAFVAGHASNSISVALGMARAADITKSGSRTIALIGDGALTGGLAYEGLLNAGSSGLPLIVILNDNGMAIGSNVGAMAKYLHRERMRPGYVKFKKNYRKFLMKLPGGNAVYTLSHSIKDKLKKQMLHSSMFEDMGFEYIGPVDGHDISQVESALLWAKDLHRPVVVHVNTKKGKGYKYSEENPDAYHGVAAFDPDTCIESGAGKSFSSVFGDIMVDFGGRHQRLCAMTAAMTDGTGLAKFAKKYPSRFFDVGIAEGHAVATCAGMAKQGLLPVFVVYSTFLQRGYDMLLHDVALDKLHVVFGIDRAGLVGEDGETHQGVFDVAYLASVPGMKVYAPASYKELRDMLKTACFTDAGPVAVRYPRGVEGAYSEGGDKSAKTIREGTDITLITYGITVNTAIETAGILEDYGISAEILKLGIINPIDFSAIEESIKKTGRAAVIEECFTEGSVGQRIGAHFAANTVLKQFMRFDLGENFVPQGNVKKLRELCEIDSASVADAIREEVNNG